MFVFILLVKTLYFLFMVGQNTVVFGVITSAAAAVTAYDWYRKAQLEKVKNFMWNVLSKYHFYLHIQAREEAERKEEEIQAERLQRLQVLSYCPL